MSFLVRAIIAEIKNFVAKDFEMTELLLNSLEIENFRAFEHLTIEKLGRVNLITGKNNVGKTSLLEALWLYAGRANPQQILKLLTSREELTSRDQSRTAVRRNLFEEESALLPDLSMLFHGRNKNRVPTTSIKIAPLKGTTGKLDLSLRWIIVREVIDSEGSKKLRWEVVEHDAPEGGTLQFLVNLDEQLIGRYEVQDVLSKHFRSRGDQPQINAYYIDSCGDLSTKTSDLWDRIQLKPVQNDVTDALRLISADIERVALVNVGNDASAIVKLRSEEEPVPLKSLGDGMNRIFGIALAMVNARDGMVLIDEFENGLHYSVQADVWRFIFEMAARLNVQVFATTHSWECVNAFQTAANESEEEGILIRLEGHQGRVVETLFDEEDLGIIAEQGIEVR